MTRLTPGLRCLVSMLAARCIADPQVHILWTRRLLTPFSASWYWRSGPLRDGS